MRAKILFICLLGMVIVAADLSFNFKPELQGSKFTQNHIESLNQSVIPTPSPRFAKPVNRQLSGTNQPKILKGSPLCKGVIDPWTLVPDPKHKGQFVICNPTTEKMTIVDELNTAVNNYRKTQGLNPLNIDQTLCAIASQRATEIAVDFSHDGFEQAIERSGLELNAAGENIASGPLSGVRFVEWSWDKSPGHRTNMLRDWLEGCGGVYDRFAVFIFAK